MIYEQGISATPAGNIPTNWALRFGQRGVNLECRVRIHSNSLTLDAISCEVVSALSGNQTTGVGGDCFSGSGRLTVLFTLIGGGVGPFGQHGAVEPFHLPIRLGSIGTSAPVPNRLAQSRSKQMRPVT